MDANYLESFYNEAKEDLLKHSRFRLNFGAYYTPRF